MQLLCIPPIIHHIIFNVLIKIAPIIYFISGIIFTIMLEIYLFLILIHSPKEQYYQRITLLNPDKHLNIEDKLKMLKENGPFYHP